ncbi:MAG TPA: hypothetical protein VHD38_00835 [Candidatus Paceibacterota bacterium]|nr:hypothetical protein [Candidatus Paceibacterota bacterium]
MPGAKVFVLQYDGAILGFLLAAALIFWLCSIDWSELEEEEYTDVPQTKTPPDD